jgi:hypothetical protein
MLAQSLTGHPASSSIEVALPFPHLSPQSSIGTGRKFSAWGRLSLNFQNKLHLVEAERARVLGHGMEAMEHYDRSIQLAQQNVFIQEEALANERAGRFWLEKGKPEFAQVHLRKAHDGFARWQAWAKVNALTRRSRNQEGCRGSRPQAPGPRSGRPRPRFFLEPGVWSLESLPPCARFRTEGTKGTRLRIQSRLKPAGIGELRRSWEGWSDPSARPRWTRSKQCSSGPDYSRALLLRRALSGLRQACSVLRACDVPPVRLGAKLLRAPASAPTSCASRRRSHE